MIASLSALLDDAIRREVAPAAQACAIAEGEVIHRSSHGAIPGAPTSDETLFDIASVTKVMATTSLAFALLSRQIIELEDRALRWLPELAGSHKAEIRIRHLLAHTSGLPAWLPLFAEARAEVDSARSDAERRQRRRQIIDRAAAAPLEQRPGERCIYSDLGFILLGELLARAAGAPLDLLFSREIAGPFGLSSTSYRPLPLSPAEPRAPIAPTGTCRPRPPAPGQERYFPGWREPASPEAPGEVDDDNAWAMGGVAGHAGLFSTAEDVARWGAAILLERQGARRLGPPGLLAELLRPDPHRGPVRALGFDLPGGEGSSAGSRLGRAGPLGAAGHLGFTGCSIWIDFDRRLSVALLTNRVYPSRADPRGIQALRPAFHDAVIDACSS